MSQEAPEELLTIQEAAARIGVTAAALQHATLHGRLPFVRKFGRSWIEPGALLAYQARMSAGEVVAGSPTEQSQGRTDER